MKYQCEYCSRSFDRSYNLNRHLQKVHNRYLETVDSMDDSNSNDEERSLSEESGASQTDSDASSDNSTEMNDQEWNNYQQRFQSLMTETFEEVVHELTPDEDEVEEEEQSKLDSDQYIFFMNKAKKVFRKKLTKMLVILYGMKEDKLYQYLFNKIDKYIENEINFPTAISMAIKSSSAIIDQEFEDVIEEDIDSDSSDDEQTEKKTDND